MIRIATVEDIPELLEMSMKFIDLTPHTKYASEMAVDRLLETLVTSGVDKAVVFIHEGKGMIAGAVTQYLFGPYTMAVEIGWWIDPEHRKSGAGAELLEAFEYWAKQLGCAMVCMISIDDTLGEYYEKRGYSLRERTYTKDL